MTSLIRESQRFLRRSAWRFILRYGVEELPVDVRALCRRMGVAMHSYAEAAKLAGVEETCFPTRYDPDGFVTWSKRTGGFVIYYNQRRSEEQLRWTIMHELAHVYLGHVRALRTREKGKRHAWMETEADGVARRVLCPSIVLHDLQRFEPEAIARCCGVSMQAARYAAARMRVLEERGSYRMDSMETLVEQQFAAYLQQHGAAGDEACHIVLERHEN